MYGRPIPTMVAPRASASSALAIEREMVPLLEAMPAEKLGFAPERTRVWNILITLYGIIALVIGVYALIQVFKGL